jgi:basic amino acid/polyamine antiporter, APA family
MIFVLLTYGGWNEAAYISGEVRNARRKMGWSILWGIALIATILILANLAYLKGLGLMARLMCNYRAWCGIMPI